MRLLWQTWPCVLGRIVVASGLWAEELLSIPSSVGYSGITYKITLIVEWAIKAKLVKLQKEVWTFLKNSHQGLSIFELRIVVLVSWRWWASCNEEETAPLKENLCFVRWQGSNFTGWFCAIFGKAGAILDYRSTNGKNVPTKLAWASLWCILLTDYCWGKAKLIVGSVIPGLVVPNGIRKQAVEAMESMPVSSTLS